MFICTYIFGEQWKKKLAFFLQKWPSALFSRAKYRSKFNKMQARAPSSCSVSNHLSMNLNVFIHKFVCGNLCVNVCMWVCVFCVHVCVYICMYMCLQVCVCKSARTTLILSFYCLQTEEIKGNKFCW